MSVAWRPRGAKGGQGGRAEEGGLGGSRALADRCAAWTGPGAHSHGTPLAAQPWSRTPWGA
jgi:hypothetical protein